MIETRQLVLNGKTWRCQQFAGTTSIRVLHALAKAIGPGFASFSGKSMDEDVDFGEVIEKLLEANSSAEDVQRLLDLLLQNTTVDNLALSKTTFDAIFAGPGIIDLVPVLGFVLKTNYGDFMQTLTDITGRVSVAKPATPTASPES